METVVITLHLKSFEITTIVICLHLTKQYNAGILVISAICSVYSNLLKHVNKRSDVSLYTLVLK